MNCRRIEKLIPLFVEGDLDRVAMNEVSLHLNECQNCSQILSEYDESQNWLRSHTPPEFDSAFYIDLRQSVMQEIEHKKGRPTLMQPLTERWHWNPKWAMAIAMLVLAGAVAFYIYSGKNGSNLPVEVISKDPPKPEQVPQEQRDEKTQPEIKRYEGLNKMLPVKHQKKHFQRMLERIIKGNSPSITPEKSMTFDLIADNHSDNNPINIGLFEDLKIPIDTMRMDLQTSDPNIRIIWFAPKLTDSQSSKIDTE